MVSEGGVVVYRDDDGVVRAVAEVLGVAPEPVPTAEAEIRRVQEQAAQQAPEPRGQAPEPRRSYQSLSTGQKLELILDRQEHQEKVLRLLDSKIDRVGLNTVNLSKNNQAIAAMLQALVGAMTEPEQPESLIQTVRGGF